MNDLAILKLAATEVESKTWGVTQQFLEIHDLTYEDDKLKVAHIDKDKNDGEAIVYFPVKDEKFYLAIYIRTTPSMEIIGVGTEPDHKIYLRATSEKLSFEELSKLTSLKPTDGWNKGDKRKYGNSVYSFSCIEFMPNPEPDEFEDKIYKLLDFLDKDKEGVCRLAAMANGHIQVASVFHNGNTMLGGFHLDKHLISRLKALDLEIDFDLYAEGSFFK
jgi:Domain of unknown function (DUF4279)